MNSQKYFSPREETDAPLLPGLKPILELLECAPRRVDMVLIKKGLRTRETARLLDLCRAASVRFSLVEAQALDRLCPSAHQGVIARLLDTGFTDFKELLELTPTAPLPVLLALDQVQDPGNVGTLARTLYALGGAGMILPQHNSAFLGGAARRSAAGALERLPVSRVPNLARALDEAEEAGLTICGAALGVDSCDAFTTGIPLPAVLVLGNEEKGIRPGVLKRCGLRLRIPMARAFDSLNVAQAGAVLLGLLARQHGGR